MKLACQNNKVYLNMVVHDLRNPASQINFAIINALESLNQIQSIAFAILNLKTETMQIIKDLKDEIERLKKENEQLKREAKSYESKEQQDDLRDYINKCKYIQISSEEDFQFNECNIDTILSDEAQPDMGLRLKELDNSSCKLKRAIDIPKVVIQIQEPPLLFD